MDFFDNNTIFFINNIPAGITTIDSSIIPCGSREYNKLAFLIYCPSVSGTINVEIYGDSAHTRISDYNQTFIAETTLEINNVSVPNKFYFITMSNVTQPYIKLIIDDGVLPEGVIIMGMGVDSRTSPIPNPWNNVDIIELDIN